MTKDQLKYVKPSEKEWFHIWGEKSNVVEKRLFTEEDGLPITVVLQNFPSQKKVVSDEGYKLHSHGALEIGYVIKGHSKIQFEGIGEIEVSAETIFCTPAGMRHALTEAMEETLIILYYYPPYTKPEGLVEEATNLPDTKTEFLLTRAEDREWIHAWGTKTNVAEKRYLTKEDGFPLSFLLRHIPAQKAVVSTEGYKLHSHPALEIGFMIRGGIRVYVEGLGEHEFLEGMIVRNPAGTKHAAIESMSDTMIAVVNIPPFGRTPAIVDKPGAPEEG